MSPDAAPAGRRERIPGELDYRIDRWTPNGRRIDRGVAFADDLAAAQAAFAKLVELYPDRRWTLRRQAHVLAEHPERAWG
jgi:hypothetical protein